MAASDGRLTDHAPALPVAGNHRAAYRVLVARGLRGLADGWVAVLLPAYLLALGHGSTAVGVVSTAALLGSAMTTLLVGAYGYRWSQRAWLIAAAALMAASGLAFGSLSSLWPLLVVAFVGTLNPSGGDASLFVPLEHAHLAGLADGPARTRLFARYTMTGSLCAAFGALLAGVPTWVALHSSFDLLEAMRAMFFVYGLVGVLVWWLYRGFASGPEPVAGAAVVAPVRAALGPSRLIVMRLAALFSVDAFAGGLVVNALLALWLHTRFGMSTSAAGVFFFWAGLLTTASQWLAPKVAERFGLLNTMVFTHIPSSLCLMAAALMPTMEWALALLFMRSALSQMDVPTRSAFVMAVVTPAERPAAASFTAVPRGLAAAVSPALGGAMFAAGWLAAPLVVCGVLKIGYDLALWLAFKKHDAA